ncbi:MAG: hypothetical protein FWF63_09010 [Fibromonadales bacterium]|nr:hypothetical protein [Fibromonadales bacterium]
MKNSPSKLTLAVGFLLALTFTFSCSSDDGGGSGGGSGSININPQVYEDDGSYIDDNDVFHYKIKAYNGSGNIKVYIYDYEHKDTLISAGRVTNGIVNLELPSIPNEYFSYSSDLFFKDGESCTSYPETVKLLMNGTPFVLIDNNGKEVGYLGLGIERKAYENAKNGTIEEHIEYMYFQKDVKITCKKETDYEGTPYLSLANIDAKKGWNVIYYSRYYESPKKRKSEYSTNSNILKNVKEIRWFFSPPYEF